MLPSLSVVVPVFRGAATLAPLVGRLGRVLERAAERSEVLLVDDGSPDDSWLRISELAAERSFVRGLRLERNFGQEPAVRAGLDAALGGTLVTMDDDLQHPPEEIPKLLAALSSADLVYGVPIHAAHPLWRRAASRTARGVVALGGRLPAGAISGFRAFDARLRPAPDEDSAVALDALLSRRSPRVAAVRVLHEPRRSGRSGYDLPKLTRQLARLLRGPSPARRAGPAAVVKERVGAGFPR